MGTVAISLSVILTSQGTRALYSMVEICLNPENNAVGSERSTGYAPPSYIILAQFLTYSNTEALAMGVRTADRLLQELAERGEGSSRRYGILRSYSQLMSGNKQLVDRALSDLTSLANEVSRSSVGQSHAHRATCLPCSACPARTCC